MRVTILRFDFGLVVRMRRLRVCKGLGVASRSVRSDFENRRAHDNVNCLVLSPLVGWDNACISKLWNVRPKNVRLVDDDFCVHAVPMADNVHVYVNVGQTARQTQELNCSRAISIMLFVFFQKRWVYPVWQCMTHMHRFESGTTTLIRMTIFAFVDTRKPYYVFNAFQKSKNYGLFIFQELLQPLLSGGMPILDLHFISSPAVLFALRAKLNMQFHGHWSQ